MKNSNKSKKSVNTNKLIGILVVVAVIGLSLGDALNGHGIKGNKNLNPIVLGDGSSSSTGTTTTGSNYWYCYDMTEYLKDGWEWVCKDDEKCKDTEDLTKSKYAESSKCKTRVY